MHTALNLSGLHGGPGKPNPVLLLGGGIVVVVAVVLLTKKKPLAPTAANEVATVGSLAGNIRSDPNAAAAAQTAAYSDQFNQLGGLVTSGVTGLATGLHADNTTLAGSLTSGLQALVSLVNNRATQTDATVAAGNKQNSDAISGGMKGITDAITGQTGLFSDLSKKLVNVDTGLSGFLSRFTTQENALYVSIGAQSGASCFGANGAFWGGCLDNKIGTDQLGPQNAGGHGEGAAAIKQAYADCATANGYDLGCVGKKIAAKTGLGGQK